MRINITNEAIFKIHHWVDKSPVEVSGLGKITRQEGGDLLVTDVYLLDQENTATDTELDANAISKLMFETKDVEGDLSFWWHSHVNMGVFWSSTDMEAIHQLGEYGYVVASVFNKKKEVKSAYYQGDKDSVPEIFIDDIATRTVYMHSPDLVKSLDDEYAKKCKQKKFVYTPPNYGNRGSTITSIYNRYDPYYVNSQFYEWCDTAKCHVLKADRQLNLLDYNDYWDNYNKADDADHNSEEKEDRELATMQIGFVDGEINDLDPSLRFDEELNIWVPYYQYAKKHKRRRTIIDSERPKWIQACRNSYSVDTIITDDDVEDYYLEEVHVNGKIFYNKETWG